MNRINSNIEFKLSDALLNLAVIIPRSESFHAYLWSINNCDELFNFTAEKNISLLGLDIYEDDGNGPIFAYCGMYNQIYESEDHASFINRGYKEARKYLKSYPNKPSIKVLFEPVFRL